MNKKSAISLLTITILLLNMFLPNTILFNNNSYAVKGTVSTSDRPIVIHNLGSEELEDGSKKVTMQFAIVSNINNTGMDLSFKVDLDKIAPLNDSDEEDDVADNIIIPTTLMNTGKTTLQSKEYAEEYGEKNIGTFRIIASQPTGGTDYETLKKSKKFVFVPGQSGEAQINEMTKYPVYYPFITISFVIKDNTLDPDNLPSNVISIEPVGISNTTGIKYAFTNEEGTRLSAQIDNFAYEGFADEVVQRTITDITVTKTPANPTEHGNSIDLTGGEFHVTYNDGFEEDISMTDSSVSIISPVNKLANANDTAVTLSYKGKNIPITIQVTDVLETLTYKSGLSLAKYEPGDDLTGATLEAVWKSGKKETLTGVSSGVTMNSQVASIDTSKGFTKLSPEGELPVRGTQKIEFTYEGKKAETTITVNDTIAGITVKTQPTKKVYKSGESLDLTGAVVNVTLGSGGNADINLPNGNIKVLGYNNTTYGSKQNLTVKFGETTITAPTTIDVEVYNNVKNSTITIPTNASKVTYNTELAGGKLNLTYANNTSQNIDLANCTVTGFDKTIIGKQTVTVEYTVNYTLSDGQNISEKITKTFEATVVNPITDIQIKLPDKKDYNYNDILDLTGNLVTITYANGTTKKDYITANMIEEGTGENADVPNMTPSEDEYKTTNIVSKTLTITYTKGETTKTVDYPITIRNNIDSIKMGTKPDKVTYNLNEQAYDLTSTAADATEGYGDIIVIYQAGNSKMVKLTDATLTPLNTLTNTAGNNKTVTVTYGVNKDNVACTTSFTINVIDSVSSIVIDENNKIPENQKYGETINLNGAQITVTKGSGTTTIPITTDMVTYNNTTLGEQTITITYGTKTDGTPATTTAKVIVQDYVKEIILNKSEISGKYGDELADLIDDNGLTYKIVYAEAGETLAAKPVTESMIDGYNKETLDEQNLNVKYIDEEEGTYKNTPNEYLKPIKITLAKEINKIEITAPSKTEYEHGEGFDLTGGEILITYTDTSTATRTMTTNMIYENDGTTIANLTPTSYGSTNKVSKTLKIKYEEDGIPGTVDYPVTIINAIEKIELIGNPKTQYNVNEGILEGLSVKITRKVQKDGVADVKEVKVGENVPTEDTVNPIITGFNTTTEGTRIAVITYIENGVTKTVNYEYTVTDSVTSISIHTAPKEGQKYGEELDLTGAKINVVKGSATEQKDITTSMIKTGTYNKNQLGEQTVTVQYGTKPDGTPITTTFKVIVQDYVKEIILNKTEISGKYGDELADLIDDNGLTYKIVYAEAGETLAAKPVTESMIDGYNKETLDEQNLNVKYIDEEEGTYKNTPNEYLKPIKITLAKEINKIEITAPSKTEYEHGEGFDLTGGEILITYTDTSTATRTMTTNMIYENDGTTIANLTPTSYGSTNKVSKTLKIKYEEDGIPGTVDYPVTIINAIEKIELIGNPKTQYNVNEGILEGLSVKITRKVQKDGVADVKEVKVGENVPTEDTVNPIITGFNTTTEGTRIAVITYIENGVTKTVNYEYTVTDSVTSISIHTAPKEGQKYGEELDLTGAKINVVKGSKTEQIDITASMIKTGTYNKNQLGEQTVTVQYGTKADGTPITTTFKVTVQDYVKSVEIVPPSKIEYQYNTDLDLSDSKIIKTMASAPDKPQTIQVTGDMISGYDKTQTGTQTVKITYKDDKTYTKDFQVTVTRAINNIELINEGFKTQYLYNENLDLSTLKLKITYTDGTTKNIPVTTAMINGYNPKQLGEQNITLKYETFEQGLQVTVQDYIKDIELTLPTKKQYELEEELDLTGGSITTIMASGAVGVTVPLTQGTITGFDSTTPGTKTINVTYEEKSKTFKVVVKGPEEEDYIKEEQFNEPTKKEYKVGDTIDLTGGSITQIMASGKIVKIDLTNDMIQGFDSTTPGTKTIKVSYNGKTYTYTINVKDEILGISIQTLPDKLEYKKGEELNITGATLNVISLSGVKTINITKEMIQGYDSSREGTQVISVNYEGFSAQFSITVQKEDKEANDNKPNNNKPNNNTNKPNTKPSDKVIYVPVKEEKPVEEQPKQEIPEEPKEEEPKQEEVKKPEINKDDKDKVVPVIGTTNNNQTPPTSGLLSKQNMLYLLGGILGLLGISLIIALIEKNKKNVKIYLEEGGQKVLVGKEKVSKKNTVLDLNKYYDEYQEDKYQIVLSKSINKKLDQRSVNLIVHDKKESFVVNSNNESCSYRI